MFSYPLDTKLILRKKNSLKKQLSENSSNFLSINIAILGGSTTHEVKELLNLFLLDNQIKANFYESSFNRFYEDALFHDFSNFKPDIFYIHTTSKNIKNFPNISDDEKQIKNMLKEEVKKYKTIWQSLLRYNCVIIQNNFEYLENKTLGNLDCYDIHGKTYFINKLNEKLHRLARKNKNLYINDINYLASYEGLKKWHNKTLYYQSKYALSLECMVSLSFNLSNIIKAILGKSKKCLVLDLDNTCWGGVIGDDGIKNIKIGNDEPISEAYSEFQHFTKELKQRGVSLAVCSKNEFENAKEGFSHENSVLSFDDFVVFEANWNDKNINIQNIAKKINIGLDSLVFIDDNATERQLVGSFLPQVSVPNVGNNPTEFIDHVDKNGYFEIVSLLDDDLQRNKYYEDNKKRQDEQKNFASLHDFLLSLDMKAIIRDFEDEHLERITQLTNKTNQFNLTTKRYSMGEMKNIYKSENHIKLYAKLEDKFGDNGVVSVFVGEKQNDTLHVNLWLMSCRVFKRDLEFALFDEVIKRCKKQHIQTIFGYYFKTDKNSLVKDLYKTLGFQTIKDEENEKVFKLNISSYTPKNSVIKVLL